MWLHFQPSTSSVAAVQSVVSLFKGNNENLGIQQRSDNRIFFPQKNRKLKSSQQIGVSIAYLKNKFIKLVQEAGLSEEDATIENLDDLRSKDFKFGIFNSPGREIKSPVDGVMGAAFVHTLKRPDSGIASTYVSYSSSSTIGEIIASLEDWCKRNGLNAEKTYVWMHCFCSNMGRNRTNRLSIETVGALFHRQLNTFKKFVAILAPWNDPTYLKRSWCIYELFKFGFDRKRDVTILMTPKDLAALGDSIRRTGDDIDRLISNLKMIRIENSSSSFPMDKIHILTVIRDGPGTTEVNQYMSAIMKTWIKAFILEAVEEEEKRLVINSSDLEYASYLRLVGSILFKNDYIEASLKTYERALGIHEIVIGKDSIVVADIYSDMGAVFEKKNDFDSAFLSYHKQLAVLKNKRGEKDSSLAVAYRNLGRILRITKQYADASELLQLALIVEETEKDKSSLLGLGLTYYELALLCFDSGEFEQAYDNIQKSLGIRERALGKEHLDTAKCHISLADMLMSYHHLDEALKHFKKGLAIMQKAVGDKHASLAPVYGKIAMVVQASGDSDAALSFYKNQLSLAEANDFGSTEELTLTYNNIGIAFYDQKKYNVALEMHKKALRLQQEKLGDKHPDVILTCKYIAEVYRAQSEPEAAVAVLRQAIDIEELVNGLFHPSVAESYNYLAGILRDRGDLVGALSAFTRGKFKEL